jgi:hypothetical protein
VIFAFFSGFGIEIQIQKGHGRESYINKIAEQQSKVGRNRFLDCDSLEE